MNNAARTASRLKRWGKRLSQVLAGLVALALLLFVVASMLRQSALRANHQRLGEQSARVQSEICSGKDIPSWFRDRVPADNGWKHVATIDAAYEAHQVHRKTAWDHDPPLLPSEEVLAWRALEALSDWFADRWKGELPPDAPDGAEPPTQPTDEQLRHWLARTDRFAVAYQLAAGCEVVAPVVLGGNEPFPWWIFQNLTARMNAGSGMVARTHALRKFGASDQADTELLHLIEVWAKYALPLNLLDCSVAIGRLRLGLEEALKEFNAGRLSATVARRIIAIPFPGERWIQPALQGEICWMAYNASRATWAMDDPSLFGWVAAMEPGDGLFRGEEFTDTLKSRFLAPLNLTAAIATAQQSMFEMLKLANADGVLAPGDIPPQEYAWFSASVGWPYEMARHVARTRQHFAALELRLLESGGKPVGEQRPEVEALVRKYSRVAFEWDGDAITLYVDPELNMWREIAAASDAGTPEDQRALLDLARKRFKDRDFTHEYSLRVGPPVPDEEEPD